MNITKADIKKPTLLQHRHLCSLFHYFGLAIHNLVSRAKYGRLLDNMEEDFIEIPGALLEQFCWETEILEDVGQHWAWISEDFRKLWRTFNAEMPSRTLSRETIGQLQTWKANNEGMEKLKECQYAMFDMGIYRPEELPARPSTIHSSVLWNQQMADSVSPFSTEAMEAIEDDWEWGQCPARLENIRTRFMGGPTKLL
jgi:Zn-dependent oligopeptidase